MILITKNTTLKYYAVNDLYADPETASEINKKAEQARNILIEMRKKEAEGEKQEQIDLQEQE